MGFLSKKKTQLKDGANPSFDSSPRSVTPDNNVARVDDVEKSGQLDNGKVPFLTLRTFIMVKYPIK